jgi:mono/diheme cytochrome c family protein
MKRLFLICFFLFMFLLTGFLLVQPPKVFSQTPPPKDLPRGAGLYDNWFALLNKEPPAGNMPIWPRQVTNTRSGADTWRCVTCHGWDYQGKEGAYKSGTNFTGFPGVLRAGKEKTKDEIISILSGKNDPAHNFSQYLDQQSLDQLAIFLNAGLIDDSIYIDPISLHVIGGDAANGGKLYNQVCSSCHGTDGAKIVFRFEGQNASLGDLAAIDPWRFLHKTRFGTPGTEMPVGFDLGWTPQQGRDVLLFAQSMPQKIAKPAATAVMEQPRVEEPGQPGGPARNVFSGIITALTAMAVGLGFNVLIGAALIGIILLLVWVLRGRK